MAGNVPLEMTCDGLSRIFGRHGKIANFRVEYLPHKRRAVAIITYSNEKAVAAAVGSLQNSDMNVSALDVASMQNPFSPHPDGRLGSVGSTLAAAAHDANATVVANPPPPAAARAAVVAGKSSAISPPFTSPEGSRDPNFGGYPGSIIL